MPKVISRLLVQTTSCDHDGLTEHEHPLNIITAEELSTKIGEAIIIGNHEEFIRLLEADFIYPELLVEHAISRPTPNGYFEEEFYEDHYTRPALEKLIFEDPAQLIQIIETLYRVNSDSFYRDFFTALRKAEIDETKVCSWTYSMREQLLVQLDDLQAYGVKLANENISKGSEIQTLVRDLREMTKHPSHTKPAKLPDNLETFNGSFYFFMLDLRFKLKFAHKLHSIDNIINEVRDHGLKKIITNILTILFSAGILNLVNRAVYSNWLFFSETRSAAKVTQIDKTLDFVTSYKT